MPILGDIVCLAQTSGNISYGQSNGRARADQNERNKRIPAPGEAPPGSNTMFLEASILMNVRADEYVAVFGLSQDGASLAECHQKIAAARAQFTSALKPLGISGDDVSVDFVAQNRIYGYRVEGNVAKEEMTGFELKKNISVHYRDKGLLDKLVIAASDAKIFDLNKVDYIVQDPEPVQNRLMEEASQTLKQKAARYEKLLGITLLPSPQLYAEKPSVYFPTEMYDSYTAYESENVERDEYRSKYIIQGARKSRTFFFNALNADGFDRIINPVVTEPVVEFTLYLKAKYDIEPRKRKHG